ncbi:MAG: prolipoprotein diacylglyceryl transferase [Thermoleophilia bacterium]
MHALLASIPSPSGGVVELGPITIRAYGVMLLLGIVSAFWLTTRRWRAMGGDPDLVLKAGLWGVGAGIVGARLYHVVTSWDEVPDEWWGVFAVWKGGLGVWGGVAAGVAAGLYVVKRSGASVLLAMDACAPGILLAQGIGRWGNYFNQELFGTPTSLPWGLEIDPENRPGSYPDAETFHPIFLYEFIWDMIGVAALVWLGRRFRLRAPAIFSLYVMWYCLARATFEESLRTDPSHEIAGLRLNHWVSIGLLLVAAAGLRWAWRNGVLPGPTAARGEPAAPRAPAVAPSGKQMSVPKSRVRKRR